MNSFSDDANPDFTSTLWLDVELFHQEGPAADAARERICGKYWFPLYVFLRIQLAKKGANPQDACDTVQSFFRRVIKTKALKDANPEIGNFRSLLCESLKNFATTEWKRSQRQKRRPPGGWVFIDDDSANERFQDFASVSSPQAGFDRAWALQVLQRALRRVRMEFAAPSKAALFQEIEPLLQGPDDDANYAERAARVNMTVGAFKVAVLRCRRRFRESLEFEIAPTIGWQGRTQAQFKMDLANDKELKRRLDEEKVHLVAALV